MRNLTCPRCRNKVYFESTKCLRCNQTLGFHSESLSIVALDDAPGRNGQTRRTNNDKPAVLRYCANATHGVCNWVTVTTDANGRCLACEHNRTIPNLSEPGNLAAWRDLERAKKRLVYSLLRFGLPLDATATGQGPLTFDFARNTVTGHLGGVITIDVIEADAVERERQRQHFGEPYRTLLGHLRHESGHFYWMVLIEAADRLDAFRSTFGDERQDYQAALGSHHSAPPTLDWQANHVSAYSSSHPWEDWAETWAHYLHMVDAVDTAEAEGMEPRASGFSIGSIWPFKKYDLYREESFHAVIDRWIPLTIAMNNVSRSMGHDDFYPFVITSTVYEKLAFVHRVIRGEMQQSAAISRLDPLKSPKSSTMTG
jgi:hypothetical protein